ncbi:Glycosyltransferase Gtf1 [bioreactor metagenome]|uniref:Glycosyltransferase Gtf1 n=1 Tax=bioreactor metagenome TaxID=1076179 RepID=A0A644ZMH6_9ZZZZ
MKKNKTLMIVFDDMALGGIQVKILDLIKRITKDYPKTKIIVCLRYRKGFFLKKIPKNIKLISPTFHTSRFDMFWFISWLTFKVAKLKPNTILSFMDLGSIPSLIAKKILFWKKIKIVIGEDILTSKYVYIESFPQIRLKLIKYLYPQANQILVQTPVQKKDLHQIIGNSDNISVSPNWLPLSFPPKKRKTKKEIDILYLGRIEAQKNLKKFIYIIKELSLFRPKIKAVIVGNGSETKTIKNLVVKLNLKNNIQILPATNYPENFYLRSKIFLLTSNYEGFPLTVLEAISCNCYPVIRNIPELKKFFNYQTNKFIFKNQQEALKIIQNQLAKPNNKIIRHYQNKIVFSQNKDISLFIKRCLE